MLLALLDHVGWKGPELRLTGNSLGTQVVLGIAGNIHALPGAEEYAAKQTRIALFDMWMGGDIPGDVLRTLEDEVLPNIRSNEDPSKWPVIENYRTSLVSALGHGSLTFLIEQTVFVELKPRFLSNMIKRHTAGQQIYLHCWKWEHKGPVQVFQMSYVP